MHRLNFLKNYRPNVELVHGFDFTGMGHEDYWCGERYNISDEKHPNFSIRYATIRTTDKAKVFRMPCYVCAVEKGEKLSSSLKTLEMIEGRMLLISEALSGHTNKLPNTPTVALCSGQKLTDGRYIGTTKTRLFFFAVNQVTHQKRRRPTTTLMFIKEATVKPVCGKLV